MTGMFEIPGRGVVLEPWIPLARMSGKRAEMEVVIRKPDGTEKRMLARFSMPHVPHPDRMCFACLLPGANKEEVPVGSEVLSFT